VIYASRDRLVELATSTESMKLISEHQSAVQNSSLNYLQTQSSAISTMNEKLDDLRSDYGSIKDAITALPAVSASQESTMVQMLKQLQDQVSALSLGSPKPQQLDNPIGDNREATTSTTSGPSDSVSVSDPNEMLSKSIEKLSALVQSKPRIMDVYDERDGDQAEVIIQDLQSILKVTRELSLGSQDPVLLSDLKRFDRVFSSSPLIALNQEGKCTQPKMLRLLLSLIRYIETFYLHHGQC